MIRFIKWLIDAYTEQIVSFAPRPVEFLLASISLFWGLWILNPAQDSFLPPTYTLAARIMPEWVVGLIFAVHGLGQMFALYLDGWRWRVRMTTLGYTLWFTIFVVVVLSNPASTLIPLSIVLTLLSANAAVRVRHANDYEL